MVLSLVFTSFLTLVFRLETRANTIGVHSTQASPSVQGTASEGHRFAVVCLLERCDKQRFKDLS